MVIGGSQTQEENKQDEASNAPREISEASKTIETNAKGAKKKEVQMKEGDKEVTEGRQEAAESEHVDMHEKGGIPVSSTPTIKMTVVELKRQLERLHLPTNGNKAELERRLRMYEDSRSNDEDDNSDNETDEETIVRVMQETDSESNSDDEEIIISDVGSRTRRRDTSDRVSHRCSANLFTIKDVEESISHFSGERCR